MVYSHFAIKTLEYEDTGTGLIITVTTNHKCHLWMRWTNITPVIHHSLSPERGASWDIRTRYCFVCYNDNEQEEDGDTWDHTFIKDPWPVCETRWFFFIGQVSGGSSPSDSAIFIKHRTQPPITSLFYPDKHPELKSVDGYTGRGITFPGEFWPILYTSPGTFGQDFGPRFDLQIYSTRDINKWCRLYRIIMLFDTSEIPPGSIILNAKLTLTEAFRRQVGAWPLFSMVVVKSFPDNDTSLVPADYHHLGTTILSNVILVSEDPVAGKYVFTLNTTGKNAVIPGDITKLGLRDFHHDCQGVPPPWVAASWAQVQFESADCGFPLRIPCLEVTYQPPA